MQHNKQLFIPCPQSLNLDVVLEQATKRYKTNFNYFILRAMLKCDYKPIAQAQSSLNWSLVQNIPFKQFYFLFK